MLTRGGKENILKHYRRNLNLIQKEIQLKASLCEVVFRKKIIRSLHIST